MTRNFIQSLVVGISLTFGLSSLINAGISAGSATNLLGTANTWLQTQTFVGDVTPSASDGGPSVGNHNLFWRYGYFSRSVTYGLKKQVTDNTLTAFINIQVFNGNTVGGTLFYIVSTDNSTDRHIRSGSVPFTVVQKSSTVTCGFGTPTDSFARTDGSSSLSITFGTAADTDSCDFTVTADSSFDVSSFIESLVIASIDADSLGVSVSAQ